MFVLQYFSFRFRGQTDIEYIQTVDSSSRISKREKYQCTCTYNFHVNSRHKRLLKLDRRSTACPAIGLATN